ncbi:hypothetical protein AWC23_06470 [Mycobacterium saskatchewanense]|uniref:HTH tetR-type domain-containing protein n=1 Tax=Mycobacterium saskatchewanense TaxID=220927 RepID=A0AAJ3NV31_9MYCO|nr:hypothetical protein AWC23_06470 [Mycobacterium saskatchewanense]
MLKAAADVFHSRGLSQASLTEISQTLNVDRATLYYYFGSKTQLFRAVILESIETVVAQAQSVSSAPGTARSRLSALISQVVVSFDTHYPALHVFVQEDMRRLPCDAIPDPDQQRLAQLADFFMDTMERLIAEGVDAGEFRDLGDARVLALIIQGSLNWMHRWFDPQGEQDAASIARIICAVFLDGLVAVAPASDA